MASAAFTFRRKISLPVAVSIGLHVALFFVMRDVRGAPPQSRVISVEIRSSSSQPVAAAPAQAARAGRRPAMRAPTLVVPSIAPPRVDTPPPPRMQVAAMITAVPDSAAVSDGDVVVPAAPAAAPVAAAAGPASARPGLPTLGSTAPGPALDVGSYLSMVTERVGRHRRYPEVALRMGLEGTVEVRVRVNPDGSLGGAPSIAESCGHEILDEEAMRIVQRAAPFPALTGHTAPVTLKVPVRFHLE